MMKFRLLLCLCVAMTMANPSAAFLVPSSATSTPLRATVDETTAALKADIDANLAILVEAANTKSVDSDTVVAALLDLERQQRALAKQDETVAAQLQDDLDGDWQLVFTTGTMDTQKKMGKINYFPIKAVQSFRTRNRDAGDGDGDDADGSSSPMSIENGIYLGDFAVLKFSGVMEFDQRKRRLQFDFDKIALFNGAIDVRLGRGQAARIGASSGLGSKSNVENAARDKTAFFNWISADDKIATARGAGGGLALWKRVSG